MCTYINEARFITRQKQNVYLQITLVGNFFKYVLVFKLLSKVGNKYMRRDV
jgi:hypothetical protein